MNRRVDFSRGAANQPPSGALVEHKNGTEQLAIEEMRALAVLDESISGDESLLESIERHAAELAGRGARGNIPEPPHRSSPEVAYRALERFISGQAPPFQEATQDACPMSARERAEAVAQAIALLRGIYDLESEIRDRLAAHRSA